MSHILLIEDEDVIRKQLSRMLERNRYKVTGTSTVEQAIELDSHGFDLILADIRLPGADGTQIIAHADPVPVIIMTSFASVRSAVDSMKLGAVDYISKPFDHDELLLLIARSLQSVQMSAQNAALQHDLQRYLPTLETLSADSPVRQLMDRLGDANPDDAYTWLYGECGSGRELLARIAHQRGTRCDGPLVFADRCDSATPLDQLQTCMQSAHGGSIVIRDPQSLDFDTQQWLAQAMSPASSRNVGAALDSGVVAISEQSPEALMTQQQLLPELAGAFAERAFQVASLRERRDDILPLADACLVSVAGRLGRLPMTFAADASSALVAYDWPGNVSELRNLVERAVLLCDGQQLQAVHLGFTPGPQSSAAGSTTCLNLDEYFRYVVLRYQEDVSETELAAMLGISRKALWERRQRMGLNRHRSTKSEPDSAR